MAHTAKQWLDINLKPRMVSGEKMLFYLLNNTWLALRQKDLYEDT